ncbi:MAG: hypothetical protein ACJAX3_002853, partial [Patiriisocius sp.]
MIFNFKRNTTFLKSKILFFVKIPMIIILSLPILQSCSNDSVDAPTFSGPLFSSLQPEISGVT